MLLDQLSCWLCVCRRLRVAVRFVAAFEVPFRDAERVAACVPPRPVAAPLFELPRCDVEALVEAAPDALFLDEPPFLDAAPCAFPPVLPFDPFDDVVRGDLAMRRPPAWNAVAVRTYGQAQRSCAQASKRPGVSD